MRNSNRLSRQWSSKNKRSHTDNSDDEELPKKQQEVGHFIQNGHPVMKKRHQIKLAANGTENCKC